MISVPKPDWLDEPKEYDFAEINNPLKYIVQEVLIKISARNNSNNSHFLILHSIVDACFHTYKSVCNLVKDDSNTFALQAHILSRSICDALFSIFILLENSEKYTHLFEVSGYRDFWDAFELDHDYYQDKPEHYKYLEEERKILHAFQERFNLTEDEIIEPSLIKHWPLPSQVLNPRYKESYQMILDEKRDYLRKIYIWHYPRLSQYSHLHWMGVAMSVFAKNPQEHWHKGKFESDAVYQSQLFLLIICSEITLNYNFELSDRVHETWQIFSKYYDEVKEYYELRYKYKLPNE